MAEMEKLSEGTSVLAQDGMPPVQVIFACGGAFRNDARQLYRMTQRLHRNREDDATRLSLCVKMAYR